VGEIGEGRGEPFEVAGRVIAVFPQEGAYYVRDDACPHQGASLWNGIVEGGSVACAWHDRRFGLADGRQVGKPKVRVGTYPVRVVGDEVLVAIG
jgi:3-phenylpropionate/trans-cinnamate dioxygenase ferredoxin subunit